MLYDSRHLHNYLQPKEFMKIFGKNCTGLFTLPYTETDKETDNKWDV